MRTMFLSLNIADSISARFAKIGEYFSYAFVRNALAVSVMIALLASVLGVILVLRRYSLIGDGLSHVAFGSAAVAATIGIFDMGIALPITILAAIFILKGGDSKKIKGDAVIAVLSAGALAIGYLVLDLGGGTANLGGDVCTALFGSSAILSIDTNELIFTCILTAILASLTAIFYYRIFSVSFDARFAKATGEKVGAYDLSIAVITAIVIVVGMKLAGALLISALIVFPAMSAMRVSKSFKGVLITSAIIATVCATFGVLLSIILETPTGATIAAADIIAFGIFSLFGKK